MARPARRYTLRGLYKQIVRTLGTVPIPEEELARELGVGVDGLRKSISQSRMRHRPFQVSEQRYYWLDGDTLKQVREYFLDTEWGKR